MNFVTAVPVLNQKEITQKFLDTLRNSERENFPLIIVDNGSTEFIRDWLLGLRDGDVVIRNGQNEGVVKALNQIWEVASKMDADYIIYLHNDVMVEEDGWDSKIKRIIESANGEIGVAGFYGAKGIGTPDIYKASYYMHQLIRTENVSNCMKMNPVIHGFRPPRGEFENVAVLDGFSLIVKVELLNKIGGFDRKYSPHHMYDNDICLESIDKGYRNIVISMDANHLGGRTDVGEDWATPFGKTKLEVHRDAHPVFYEKWHPKHVESGEHKICLPFRVN